MILECVGITLAAIPAVTLRQALNLMMKEDSKLGLQRDLIANCLGSAVIGLISLEKTAWMEHIPTLYIAVSVGFCGVLTTFSSWQVDLANQIVDDENVLDYLLNIFASFGAMTASFVVGRHIATNVYAFQSKAVLASFASSWDRRMTNERLASPDVESITSGDKDSRSNSVTKNDKSSLLENREQQLALPAVIAVGLLVLVAIGLFILLVLDESDSDWWFSACFAPLGALTRFLLSKQVKPRKDIPIQTMYANLIASGLAMTLKIIEANTSPSQPYVDHIITGARIGFCGALSTISTFVLELHTMQTAKSYIYFLSTMAASQLLCVGIRLISDTFADSP